MLWLKLNYVDIWSTCFWTVLRQTNDDFQHQYFRGFLCKAVLGRGVLKIFDITYGVYTIYSGVYLSMTRPFPYGFEIILGARSESSLVRPTRTLHVSFELCPHHHSIYSAISPSSSPCPRDELIDSLTFFEVLCGIHIKSGKTPWVS